MIRSLLFICLFSLPGLFAGDQEASRIQSLMADYSAKGMFNGSLLVARGDEVVFAGGFGFADIEWQMPNTAQTRFRLGSITKQFAATLILQLVDEGKLSLQTPLKEVIAGYPSPQGEVTIDQLLNHTGGIPSFTGMPEYGKEWKWHPATPETFIKNWWAKPCDFEPGSKFRYSNSGYYLLGTVLEKLTGKSWASLLDERIFGPLAMKHSGVETAGGLVANRARPYEITIHGTERAPYIDMSVPFSAGNLYSSVEDLHKWSRAWDAGKLLSKDMAKRMFTPGKANYGYGWRIVDADLVGAKTRHITHGGGIEGFNTLISRYPEKGYLVVLLNNTGPAALSDISGNLLRILEGQESEPLKPLAARVLQKHVLKPDFEEVCRKILAERENYKMSAGATNALGYQALTENPAVAVRIFEFNTRAFPDLGNAFDSLGEAQLQLGDKQAALANYRKALSLDPTNQNAKEIIERLSNP